MTGSVRDYVGLGQSEKYCDAWRIFGLALIFSGLPRLLILPLSAIHVDESIYSLVARDVVHGIMPLDGIFDHKPVLTYYLYALPQFLFGESPMAIRTLSVATGIISATLFGIFCREAISGDRVIVFTATIAFACLANLNRGLATQPELLMLAFIVAVWLVMTRMSEYERPRTTDLLAIGALWGASFQVNYLTAFPIIAFMIDYLVIRLRYNRPAIALRGYLLHGAVIFCGFAATVAILLLPIVIWGNVGAYFTAQFEFLSVYGVDRSIFRILVDLMKAMREYSVLTSAVCAALFVGIYAIIVRQPEEEYRNARFFVLRMLIYFGICLYAIILNGRTHEKYVLLLLPSALAIAICALSLLPNRDYIKTFFCAWLALFSVISLEKERVLFKAGASGFLRLADGKPTDTLDEIARFVRSGMQADDTIYVYDYHAMLYLSAGVYPPTRFPFSWHHLEDRHARAVGVSRADEMNSILDQAPEFVVAGSDPEAGYFTISSEILTSRLNQDYELVAVYQDDIFRNTVSATGQNLDGPRDGKVRVYRLLD